MSVKYRLVQEKRKNAKNLGKWYARAVAVGMADTKVLAKNIGLRCTVTYPDILAVISSLVTEISLQLQEGKRVKLDGLGSFKIGLKTSAAETASTFTPATNIHGLHVLFSPEVTVDSSNHVRHNPLIEGIRVENLADYQDAGTQIAVKERKSKNAGNGAAAGDDKPASGNTDNNNSGSNTPGSGSGSTGDDNKEF